MATETDLAYLAGLIDGEGCIRIKKSKAYRCAGRQTPGFGPAIQVRMVDEASIAFLHATLGGWYYRERSRPRGRPLYCWQASHRAAVNALTALRPYLRIKGDQADVVLELAALRATARQHRTKITGYRNFPNSYGAPRMVANLSLSDEYVARCEALYLRCRELKTA